MLLFIFEDEHISFTDIVYNAFFMIKNYVLNFYTLLFYCFIIDSLVTRRYGFATQYCYWRLIDVSSLIFRHDNLCLRLIFILIFDILNFYQILRDHILHISTHRKSLHIHIIWIIVILKLLLRCYLCWKWYKIALFLSRKPNLLMRRLRSPTALRSKPDMIFRWVWN